MTQVQTLSHGLTHAQKDQLQWAFGDVPVKPEPLSGTIGLLKYGGHGGSHFIQSIPGILILNTDLTPVVHRPLRGTIWPYVYNSMAVEPDPAYPGDILKAKPIRLTWDNMDRNDNTPKGLMARVTELVRMAEEGDVRRPRAVAIDTVDKSLTLAMPWIAAKLGKEFADLGEAGWVRRNSQFWDRLYYPLKAVGYPIIFVMQLYDEPRDIAAPDGRGRVNKVFPNTPLLPEKTLKLLSDECNMVAKLTFEDKTGGVDASGKFSTSIRSRRYQMVIRDAAIPYLKARDPIPGYPLPDVIDITGSDPWKKYETAFNEITNSAVQSTGQ